jgi:riboflavin biosynthesis pyrimidine reductase
VARGFLEAGLADVVYLIRAPLALGPAAVDALASLPLALALQPFAVLAQEKLGDDLLTVYDTRS